jgi:beta-galactosidase/beta-glucuronidase
VVVPLFADKEAINKLTEEQMEFFIRNIVDEVGAHPALLMYSFGNELEVHEATEAYIEKLNRYTR